MRDVLMLCLLAGLSGPLAAQVYKCKQSDGSTSYQQAPCDSAGGVLIQRSAPRPEVTEEQRSRNAEYVSEKRAWNAEKDKLENWEQERQLLKDIRELKRRFSTP